MRKKIFCLVSEAPASGKSTVSKFLHQDFGYKRMAIAYTIKEMALGLLTAAGLTTEDAVAHCFGDKKEEVIEELSTPENRVTSRRILQYFGTELRHALFDNDVWLRILNKNIINENKVVIDDIRYQHEIVFFANQGYEIYVVKIVRPGAKITSKHPTEHLWDDKSCDFVINNNGSLEELRGQVKKIMLSIH